MQQTDTEKGAPSSSSQNLNIGLIITDSLKEIKPLIPLGLKTKGWSEFFRGVGWVAALGWFFCAAGGFVFQNSWIVGLAIVCATSLEFYKIRQDTKLSLTKRDMNNAT